MFPVPPPAWNKRNETKELPHIEVEEDLFVEMFMENNGSREDALFHLSISKAMGSYVHIGDKMVKVISEN